MRVLDWRASKPMGGDCGAARLRPAMAIATTTIASHAAERSFGLHHNYIQRPRGHGGSTPG